MHHSNTVNVKKKLELNNTTELGTTVFLLNHSYINRAGHTFISDYEIYKVFKQQIFKLFVDDWIIRTFILV